uniref:Uncharacterized protein n=1 Tax=Glossina palpalis gambiensis TaxID=67801 RepID=A0A1B0BGY8_9MUSC
MKFYIGFLFLILWLLAVASTSSNDTEIAVKNVEHLPLPSQAENRTRQTVEQRGGITCRVGGFAACLLKCRAMGYRRAAAYTSASTIARFRGFFPFLDVIPNDLHNSLDVGNEFINFCCYTELRQRRYPGDTNFGHEIVNSKLCCCTNVLPFKSARKIKSSADHDGHDVKTYKLIYIKLNKYK